MCTVKTNQFYIPGETNLVERLRKLAIDSGTYSTLCYIYDNISEGEKAFKDLKNLMNNKVFNFIDLTDLNYQIKVYEMLKQDKSPFIQISNQLDKKDH